MEDKDKGKNPYDAYSSTAIDKHTEDYAKVFLGLKIVKLNHENCVIKQEQEVRLDHIYKVLINDKPHLLHIEDQTEDHDMLQRKQTLYYGHIDFKTNKDNLPIMSFFVVLLPKSYFKRQTKMIEVKDNDTKKITRIDTLIVTDMRDIDPQIILDNHLTAFIPFIPFMKPVSDENKKAIYREAINQIQDIEHIEDKYNQKKYFLLFYKKRFGDFNLIKELSQMTAKELIKEFNLEDIVEELKEDWIEEGIEKGIKKGIKKGIEKGREEGREEGREKGREEGEKKTKIETAKKMKEKKLSIDFIIEITGLTKEEIENL